MFFEDFDFIAPRRAKAKKKDAIEKEAAEIDGLLEDEFDEDYDEKPSIDINNPSIKVEEDDMSDIEESS